MEWKAQHICSINHVLLKQSWKGIDWAEMVVAGGEAEQGGLSRGTLSLEYVTL